MKNRKMIDYIALMMVSLTFLVPTIFSLTWIVHLLTPIPFIEIYWNINLGSTLIGIIGIQIVSDKYPSNPKTNHEEKESDFYSAMLQCLLGFNMGITLWSSVSFGTWSGLKEIPFGIYGFYGITGAAGMLIFISIVSMIMLTFRYRKYLKKNQ